MKTLGILQPGYLPWLGFFEQMDKADIFVIYDDVQFDKNGWRNRNRIKTPQGEQWLSVPVLTSKKSSQLIYEVKIDNRTHWRKKHRKTIEQNYRKAPFFEKFYPVLEKGFLTAWDSLLECDMYFINEIKKFLQIDTPLISSRTLHSKGDSTDRLIKICNELKADTFYEGLAGKNYIDESLFQQKGLKLVYQQYGHPVYKQLYKNFISHLSVIDLIFNEGPGSLDIIRNKR
ncbi:WbqC family protein [bacterium]|nr:WbqC family protein [bacterium]